MSLSIEHAQYFSAAYVQRVGAATQQESAAASGQDAPQAEAAQSAPPLVSGKPLLSAEDTRMLMLRGVNADEKAAYGEILGQFFADPANAADPVGFLRNLSSEGVELLRKAQSIGKGTSIDVNSMTREEATNFILPHTQKVDYNNDGFIGGPNGAKSFQFPPPNAPQSVKDAWDDATANMSDLDKMLLSGRFLGMTISANLHADGNGGYTITSPDSPEWHNVFAESDFSYRDAIKAFQEGNELSRNVNTPEIYERTKELLARLDQAFANFGVA